MSELLKCRICYAYYTGPMALPCLHSYCSLCIRQYLRSGKESCPECRAPVRGVGDLKKNTLLEEIVLHYQKYDTQEQLKDAKLDQIELQKVEQSSTNITKDNSKDVELVDLSLNLPVNKKRSQEDSLISITPKKMRRKSASMVDCPICFEPIKHKDINRHIDTTHLTNSLLSSKKQNKSQNNLIMTAADSDFDKKTPLVTDLQTAPSPIKIMKRTSRNTNPKYRPVIIDDEITPNLQENGSNKLPIPITQPQILTDLPPFSSTDNFARLERDSVKKSTQDYKPTIAYHLYKDNKIRALLQNEALSSYGDRSSLIKRHSQWIMMFNANCDSSQPKSLKELRSDLNDWEQLNATRTTQPQNSNHELTKEYQNSITNHLFKYKEHFEELIEEIKARKSNCKKKNPEIEKDIKS